MAVRYDVYESPSSEQNGGEPRLHARVITDGTITSADLAEKIQFSSSLTTGDVKAVLSALSYHLVDMLAQGRRVHLEGLGYFQMTLECDSTQRASKIRAEDISFKSVAFRAEKSVKDELKMVKFVRTSRKKHSLLQTDEEIEELLIEYFKNHTYIVRAQFEELTGLTRTTAFRRINKLLKEGKLKKGGGRTSSVYEWVGGEEDNKEV